jgi:energy-coupling factor transporter ATP-binding protein EcfA2
VSRSFGGLVAVDNVDLTVRQGERRALIGPNGAGKTTLFNLISGELGVSAGAIRLFDRDVTDLAPHRRAALGLQRTFQITNLPPQVPERSRRPGPHPTKFSMLRPLERYRDGDPRTATLARSLDDEQNLSQASSASSRSRWPWPGSRACCCWTSPPPASRPRSRG